MKAKVVLPLLLATIVALAANVTVIPISNLTAVGSNTTLGNVSTVIVEGKIVKALPTTYTYTMVNATELNVTILNATVSTIGTSTITIVLTSSPITSTSYTVCNTITQNETYPVAEWTTYMVETNGTNTYVVFARCAYPVVIYTTEEYTEVSTIIPLAIASVTVSVGYNTVVNGSNTTYFNTTWINTTTTYEVISKPVTVTYAEVKCGSYVPITTLTNTTIINNFSTTVNNTVYCNCTTTKVVNSTTTIVTTIVNNTTITSVTSITTTLATTVTSVTSFVTTVVSTVATTVQQTTTQGIAGVGLLGLAAALGKRARKKND